MPIPLTTTLPGVHSTPRFTTCATHATPLHCQGASHAHAFALLASAHPYQPKDQLDALMAINKPKTSHFTTSTTPPHSLYPSDPCLLSFSLGVVREGNHRCRPPCRSARAARRRQLEPCICCHPPLHCPTTTLGEHNADPAHYLPSEWSFKHFANR
jgi:hypothetical protein